ncbi:WecB/TagA/CpsF family glycosyltransferase [Ruficoccus amylovorans]|uniref:WecB/TagA/CpsF family glycosyltransferase n=1 Tax=Ruficoccus amylovorans TaxID=1804625 RepID=A0A842HE92_9BACT|nr:WecB/TagA/CpsF family glycosyltransferase [Ruficoccus amylovorans]MBC2594540.1 WecB/TagA/CpsF family glycosyltransferase [Ruficoccus amylovorans]
MTTTDKTVTILGLTFYTDTLEAVVEATARDGGLLVAPAGPNLGDIPTMPEYYDALANSDYCLTDSGLLVLLWNLTHRPRIPKISGYLFFRELIKHPVLREPGATFWIMPSEKEMRINLAWLSDVQGIPAREEDCYLAPLYPGSGEVRDDKLAALLEERRPRFVFNNIGGGTQERLGHTLLQQLSYRPAIICTGAAIAFFTGQQANIPRWVDKLYLGWLARILSDPRRYFPRYWRALRLVPLFLRYGAKRPAICTTTQS